MIPPFSGQFDFEEKKRQILRGLQDGVLGSLRKLGAVRMTSGVTKPLSTPSSGIGLLQNLNRETNIGYDSEGPRWLDRHATEDASLTYRNRRFQYFADMFGMNEWATDSKSGLRVNGD